MYTAYFSKLVGTREFIRRRSSKLGFHMLNLINKMEELDYCLVAVYFNGKVCEL